MLSERGAQKHGEVADMVGVSAGRFGWMVEAVGLLVPPVEEGNDLAVGQYGLRLEEHTLPSCAANYEEGTRLGLL